ncbi:MAG: hypothetical protein GWO20_14025 [Candidatus Korarchaeota archaeon]|nr:hypothetical protein [Candidatus Korarchaeota archaeon]
MALDRGVGEDKGWVCAELYRCLAYAGTPYGGRRRTVFHAYVRHRFVVVSREEARVAYRRGGARGSKGTRNHRVNYVF